MKLRRVFSTADLQAAEIAIDAARTAGVPNDDISLIARSDIEMQQIPDDRLDASSDAVPAAVRGAATGGAMGLLAGLVGVAFPVIGITAAGVALVSLVGAAVGGWSSALMGSAVPNAVRRTFEEEIAAGRILVIIDDEESRAAFVDAAIMAAGATHLPFHQRSAAA